MYPIEAFDQSGDGRPLSRMHGHHWVPTRTVRMMPLWSGVAPAVLAIMRQGWAGLEQ